MHILLYCLQPRTACVTFVISLVSEIFSFVFIRTFSQNSSVSITIKRKTNIVKKPRFEIACLRLYFSLIFDINFSMDTSTLFHIAARQSYGNIKAYNRTVRQSHSNVQLKENPRRISDSPLLPYLHNSSHEK